MKWVIYIGLGLVGLVVVMLTWGLITVMQPVSASSHPSAHESDTVRVAYLRRILGVLCDLPEPRSVRHMPSLNMAADFIKAELEQMGYSVEEQRYSTDGKTFRNLRAFYGDKDRMRLIVGAHYDVCGDQQGADDNASGIAGMLALAQQVMEERPELDHTLEFVAFSTEEPPYFATESMGSNIHALSLQEEGVDVKAMICLEMIGYFTDAPKSQSYPLPGLSMFYPSVGNFIGVVGKMGDGKLAKSVKKLMLGNSAVPIYSINAPSGVPGLDLSDHRNYWRLGYKAVMITDTSFFRNHNYHQVTDTPDTLDFIRMGEVVKGLYHVVIGL